MTTVHDPSFEPFHSAVNRIPVLRTASSRLAQQNKLPSELFSDEMAVGHDYLAPKRLSGRIDLKLTVHTPLVYGEQTRDASGRSSVAIPLSNGNPFVPPTMVKGMISRAYEALTCSRFRVFGALEDQKGERRVSDDHKTRLTYRSDPASALSLVPLRVVHVHDDGSCDIHLLRGDTDVNSNPIERGVEYPTMHAASLQAEREGHCRPLKSLETIKKLTQHRAKITCHMSLCLHGDRGKGARYAYWQVTHVQDPTTREFIHLFEVNSLVTVVDRLENVTGFVCRTTAPSDRPRMLFPRKHDERVFFDISDTGPERVTVDKTVAEAFQVVVDSYVHLREQEKKLSAKLHPHNMYSYEAHTTEHCRPLTAGDLAFAVVREGEDGESLVEEIVPMMIGRRAYAESPESLAKAQRVAPLSSKEEASAADRLFGYVISDSKGQHGGDVALRGSLSCGPVDFLLPDNIPFDSVSQESYSLAPLLSAKPSSARRFLTSPSGGIPTDAERRHLARGEYYSRGQLLGAAAFPTHRLLLGKRGFPTSATQRLPVEGMRQDNDKVALTVDSWIKPGSILTCSLTFSNITRSELGALLWILNPRNLVPESERDDAKAVGFLKMGLGKPLGLGAIEVRATGLHVRTNEETAKRYESLDGCIGDLETTAANLSEYPLPFEENLLKTPWVRALQRSAFGYGDGIPVRYMTLSENKENNQTDFKTGRPKSGRAQSPASLAGRDPQPLEVPRPPERNTGHKTWARKPGRHW